MINIYEEEDDDDLENDDDDFSGKVSLCRQDYPDDDGGYDPLEDADDLWSSSDHDGFFDSIYGKPATQTANTYI